MHGPVAHIIGPPLEGLPKSASELAAGCGGGSVLHALYATCCRWMRVAARKRRMTAAAKVMNYH